MALTIHTLIATLRRATPHQLTALRSTLGIITQDLEEMAAPLVSLPYADFFQKSIKADNNIANKRREMFLATLYDANIPVDAPTQLRQLYSKWQTVINSLCPTEFSTVRVMSKGGRGQNYDFTFEYLAADGTITHIQKAEFKHGAATIEKLPQILNLAAKGLTFPLTYAEFYYDNFLARYCATDSEITVAPPDRDTYLKLINTDKYDVHPFFRCLYDHEETAKKAKAAVVNESINAYLTAYADKCDLTQLGTLMNTKQKNKAFLLWDMTNFHIVHLSAENLTPIAYRGVNHKGNTIEITTATHILKLLLRWKNHKGILLPAWQIGLAKL